MALIGNISGSSVANPVLYVTGGLHLTASGNPGMEDNYPHITIESTSGSLTHAGGVSDKLHNRNGTLYFGAANLQGGITVANDSNANGVLTGDGDGTYSNEGNLEFDGTDLLVAAAGKIAFRDNGGEYIQSSADNFLHIAAGGAILLNATQISGAGALYSATALHTSLHVRATGSIIATGSVVSMNDLACSGNLDTAGDLTAATITCAGFAVDSDGDTALKSLAVDDGSTIGPDSVTDLLTLSADGDITFKDGAYDFNIASHDGTNGLALGGTIVTATAANINLNQGLTAGTVAASKTVTVDSNKDVGDFRNVTATGLATVGSITASIAIMPNADITQDLGSAARRWRNIFTGDLHLANDRGNWTVIEESNYLTLRNNDTGKRFKIEMSPLVEGEYGPGNDGKL